MLCPALERGCCGDVRNVAVQRHSKGRTYLYVLPHVLNTMINTVSMVLSMAMGMTGFRHSTTRFERLFRYVRTRAENDNGMPCVSGILFRHLSCGFQRCRNINSVPLFFIVLLSAANVVKHVFSNAAIWYGGSKRRQQYSTEPQLPCSTFTVAVLSSTTPNPFRFVRVSFFMLRSIACSTF